MKTVKIGNETAYYIGKLKDNIWVVVDNINPLEYPYEFGEALYKLSQNIAKNNISVYIDFSKWKRYPKIIKLTYLKDIDNIDVYSGEEVDINEIPKEIKKKFAYFSTGRLTKTMSR